ncbi:MAG TPA: polyphosphate kinase 2 family protein [Candidatus Acidoferrales bacterium]|nr:polyphosphate kinase 2 family protein [Candidatus Acidoferrales bacterium]
MKPGEFAKPFKITDGGKFRLKGFSPEETLGFDAKEKAQETLDRGISRLNDLQDKLIAQDRWALLLIFQGMDAAGKDSTIKHVMSGVNPEGCHVHHFGVPSEEELNHDFLWRATQRLPARGNIGIFSRSYYEEVLVVRVHPHFLKQEKLDPTLVTPKVWEERFEDIVAFERYLRRNGIVVRKFFLNVSKKEQKQRFLARLDEPEKHWKFSVNDVKDRECWGDFMRVYEEIIQKTSTAFAPWYVVPADHKWFTRLVVAEAIVDALEELNLSYPKLDANKREEFKNARALLEHEK